MLPEFRYFPLNWADGMKISSQEFIGMENAFQEALRDVRCQFTHEFAYGLLPTSNHEVERYPKFRFDAAQSSLILLECRAITPGGSRIEISEHTFETQAFPGQLPSAHVESANFGIYEVWLLIHPSERVGAGRYVADLPPRHSNVSPRYELSLVRKGDQGGGFSLNAIKISELEFRDGRLASILSESGDYIPPCLTISAHHRLKAAHKSFEDTQERIVQQSEMLLHNLGPQSEQNQDIKEAIQVAEKIGLFMLSRLGSYRLLMPHQPPVALFAYFIELARYTRFTVNLCFRGSALVKRVYDQFKVSDFTDRLLTTPIKQHDIYPNLACIADFLDALEQFINALRQAKPGFTPRVEDVNKAPIAPQPVYQPQPPPAYQPPPPPQPQAPPAYQPPPPTPTYPQYEPPQPVQPPPTPPLKPKW